MKSLSARARHAGAPGFLAAIGLAGLAAAVVTALAVAATAQTDVKPANTSPPTVSGTPTTGNSLTANPGTWSGSPAPSFAYQWERCDATGGSCANIVGATAQTYNLTGADTGDSLRVHVTASNTAGSASATTVPTAVIAAAATQTTSTTATTTAPASNGCPQLAQGASAVAIGDVASPARLQVDGFQPSPGVIPGSMTSFSLRIHVSDTCGQAVSGANVYATAVPFNQITIPAQTATGSDGWVTLQFSRRVGFPASRKQRLLVMFIRASAPGQNPLAGVSTERLVSLPLNLGT